MRRPKFRLALCAAGLAAALAGERWPWETGTA